MVLESLVNPFKAENHPWKLLLMGFIYCTIAAFLSLWIFKAQSSLITVFLIVLACVPVIYNIIKIEEEKDLEDLSEKKLLKEHSKALRAFMMLFFGITLAYILWYVVLPSETVSFLFEVQTDTIQAISGGATSLATGSFIHS